VVGDSGAVGAHWVAGGAVGAEDWCVAVQESEVLWATGVLLLGGAVEDVVGLVGGVEDIAPEESSGNFEMLVCGEKIDVIRI
jgi:hypothetical protein